MNSRSVFARLSTSFREADAAGTAHLHRNASHQSVLTLAKWRAGSVVSFEMRTINDWMKRPTKTISRLSNALLVILLICLAAMAQSSATVVPSNQKQATNA